MKELTHTSSIVCFSPSLLTLWRWTRYRCNDCTTSSAVERDGMGRIGCRTWDSSFHAGHSPTELHANLLGNHQLQQAHPPYVRPYCSPQQHDTIFIISLRAGGTTLGSSSSKSIPRWFLSQVLQMV